MKGYNDRGRDMVWLTGSRRTIWRNVYEQDGRFFVKWYGALIEVKRGDSNGFVTVEKY